MPALDLTGIALDDLDFNPNDLQSQQDSADKKEKSPASVLDLKGIESVGETSFMRPARIPPASATKGGKVRSGYGFRKDPISGKEAFHDGMDFPTPIGTPINPFGIGTVTFSGNRGQYGKSIGVNYGNGITIFVNHLSKINVEVGDNVRPEAIVGLSGNTGKSTGPHVHVQAIKDGVSINPLRVFANDPRVDGLALKLRDIIADDDSQEVQAQPNLDLEGIDEEEIPSLSTLASKETPLIPEIDATGVDQVTENTVLNDNNQIDTDVVKFVPKEKTDIDPEANRPFYSMTLTMDRIAKGIASTNEKPIKPRYENPNKSGKPISLIVQTKDGKPPTQQDINTAAINNLGIADLNERFRKDLRKRFGAQVEGQDDILDIIGAKYSKFPDGSYKVDLPYGHSSGVIAQVNAYARGGLDAFIAKQNELKKQAEVYRADIEEQKARPKALIDNHPFLSAVIESATQGQGMAIKHGLQEVALGEMQLIHSLSMLPQAFYTSNVHGFDSKEYANLIREDLKAQLPISEALGGIPEEKTLLGKIARGGTVAVGTLPRFMAAGQLGSFSIPTMVFVENLHKGSRDALLAALPMAVMMGSMHGIEEFIGSSGNPLDVFKKSEIANDELINSISSRFPYDATKFGNQLYMVAETKGIPLKVLDFNPITPTQRQLVMRGSNGLLNLGVSALTNPNFGSKEGITSLVIGLGLPVGKGRVGEFGRFERPSIITGDAYTLSDGSVLLQAPVSLESGLIGGRIPTEAPYRYNPITDLTALPPSPDRLLASGVEGNVTDYQRGKFWGQGRIGLQQGARPVENRLGRAALLDIDTAALNLIDLKRALDNKDYISSRDLSDPALYERIKATNPSVTPRRLGELYEAQLRQPNLATQTARELTRKMDLEAAIRILDNAIPPETQRFFEQNEKVIREAIKTNYESRIKKEEFIKGQKILRKPDSLLSTEDIRPYSPNSSKSATDNFMQRARRTMVSVEEAGKKGLENNKKNKGSFNVGLDPSDIPYLVQIGIGKLGRKGLDAASFINEMVAEHGDEFKEYGMEVYKQAKSFVDGVNGLADFVSSKYISSKGDLKQPPFPVADMATIKNIYYIGSKYLKEAREEDIPLDKVIATQKGVKTEKLLRFGEDPYLALLEGRTDIVGNPEVPKAIKINDNYYLFDGHHRSSSKKITGDLTIRGRVIDLNEIATKTENITSRAERAKETFGETGSQNKWFTQERQIEVRENFLKPPDSSELQEGVTASAKWFANNTSSMMQIVGFHIEDLYRRGIEPKLSEVLNRLRVELGRWVDSVDIESWRKVFNNAIHYYQANNADPFFSGLKQASLEILQSKIDTKQLRGFLKNYPEAEFIAGLEEFLLDKETNNKGKLTKDEFIDFINTRQVKLEEQIRTQEKGNLVMVSQTGSDVTPFGGNKRQVAFILPGIGRGIEEEHFGVPDVIGHMRYDYPRFTSDNIKVAHGDEFQSNMMQEGRRKGFTSKLETEQDLIKEGYRLEEVDLHDFNYKLIRLDDLESYTLIKAESKVDAVNKALYELNSDRIPKNLFMGNAWMDLEFKRFIRLAAEEGAEGITWTTARRQRERYGDNIVVKALSYDKHSDGSYTFYIDAGNGRQIEIESLANINASEIQRIFGQEIGDKILNGQHDVARNSNYAVSVDSDGDVVVINLRTRQYVEDPLLSIHLKFESIEEAQKAIDNGGVFETKQPKHYEHSNPFDGSYIDRVERIFRNGLLLDSPNKLFTEKDGVEKPIESEQELVDLMLHSGPIFRYKDPEIFAKTLDGNLMSFSSEEAARHYLRGVEGEIDGLDIEIGTKFTTEYDQHLVTLANKLGKKYGAKYSKKEIAVGYKNSDSDKLLLIPATKLGGRTFFIWETPLEQQIGDEFSTREQAIANPPEGKWQYLDDAYRPIPELNEAVYEDMHFLEITPQMKEVALKEGFPIHGLPTTEPLKPSSPFGTRNRIITRDVFDSTKESLLRSLQEETGASETSSRTVFNSGLNPEAFLDQTRLLYKGWQDFSEFAKSLTRKYGTKIEPYLQSIWDWIKAPINALHEDERGFINFGKKKKLYKGDELDIFESNRSSLTRRISYKIHRGIALAQTYEPFGQVAQTMRGLQRTTNAYSTTILEQLTRSVSLLKEDKNQSVAQAILARNKEQVQDVAEDARIITRFGLNPEQIQAYNYIRSSVSNVLDLRRDTLLYKEYRNVDKINQDILEKGWPTGGTPINPQHAELLTKLADVGEKIQKVEDYYQSLKDSGYISLQRLGRFRAELENPVFPKDDPNHYLIDYTKTAEEAQKRINEWKDQHAISGTGKILDAHKPGDFRELSRNLTPGDFEELVAGAAVPNTKEVEALRAEVYEKYPSMGYQLKRKFYPGYPETNEFVVKSIAHQAEVYSSSYYNNLGREEGLRSLEATGLDKTDPDLWNIARQYIEDETSTPRYNLGDKVAFKARKFTYMMQLAYDIKQLYLNMFVQPITQNYGYLARVENPTSGKRLGGIAEVEKTFVIGTKYALKLAKEKFGSKTLSDPEFNEFRDIYSRLKLERVIEPEFNKSLLELEAEKVSNIDNAFQSRTRKFFSRRQQEHWAGAFMRAGEVGTRTQMAASLFVAGKRFGLTGESLVDFIVRGVDATQTNPTRGENPYIIRQTGEIGKLFYQFGAFRHMWFENLVLNAKSDWQHRSIAATSRTLAPLAIIAGINGLPLTGFAFTLYSLATGKNPNEDLKKWIKRKIADNNYLENAALYGATGNASFSQSAGITTPILDTAADQLTQDQWLDRIFSSNVPALLTVKQLATGLKSLGSGLYHEKPMEVLRAVEEGFPLKPVRMAAKSVRASRQGYRTKEGHVLYGKKKITIPEQILQVMGTTPNKVIEEYDERKYKKLRRSPVGKASRRFYKKLTH